VPAITRLHLPGFRSALDAHVAALSPEDLRQRFCHYIQPQGLTRFLDRLVGDGIASYGIFNPGLELVAVCQCGGAAGELEVGLSVLPAYRRKGLAAALLARAASHARSRGFTALIVHCLAENTAILTLARRIGMHIEVSSGEADGRMRLRAATALDVWAEVAYDQAGIADAVAKAWAGGVTAAPD
jgi:GNAT superfamily N-acetyltransferase